MPLPGHSLAPSQYEICSPTRHESAPRQRGGVCARPVDRSGGTGTSAQPDRRAGFSSRGRGLRSLAESSRLGFPQPALNAPGHSVEPHSIMDAGQCLGFLSSRAATAAAAAAPALGLSHGRVHLLHPGVERAGLVHPRYHARKDGAAGVYRARSGLPALHHAFARDGDPHRRRRLAVVRAAGGLHVRVDLFWRCAGSRLRARRALSTPAMADYQADAALGTSTWTSARTGSSAFHHQNRRAGRPFSPLVRGHV